MKLLILSNMASINQPLPPTLMTAFQTSVEAHFTHVAEGMRAHLLARSPSEYGFSTEHAEVVIGVYYGHFPGLCVTLRELHPGRKIAADGGSIGLANVIALCEPSWTPTTQPEEFWTEHSLDAELKKLAGHLLRYGKPFLTDSNADWAGLRRMVDERCQRLMAESPWLSKFSHDA